MIVVDTSEAEYELKDRLWIYFSLRSRHVYHVINFIIFMVINYYWHIYGAYLFSFCCINDKKNRFVQISCQFICITWCICNKNGMSNEHLRLKDLNLRRTNSVILPVMSPGLMFFAHLPNRLFMYGEINVWCNTYPYH